MAAWNRLLASSQQFFRWYAGFTAGEQDRRMADRNKLIQQVLGFQEKIYDLITEYDIQDWLSLDLTSAQLKSLIYIQDRRKINFKELSEVLHVTPSVVTGIIDRLVAPGMVTRPASIEDRRIQWLTATDKGQTTLHGIKQKISADLPALLDTLSEGDLAALVQGVSALFNAVETYCEPVKAAGMRQTA
jgi:DNA-binding MarR family transcriptional regulator